MCALAYGQILPHIWNHWLRFVYRLCNLSPVHTSNNVEATGNCWFDIVAGVDRALHGSTIDIIWVIRQNSVRPCVKGIAAVCAKVCMRYITWSVNRDKNNNTYLEYPTPTCLITIQFYGTSMTIKRCLPLGGVRSKIISPNLGPKMAVFGKKV